MLTLRNAQLLTTPRLDQQTARNHTAHLLLESIRKHGLRTPRNEIFEAQLSTKLREKARQELGPLASPANTIPCILEKWDVLEANLYSPPPAGYRNREAIWTCLPYSSVWTQTFLTAVPAPHQLQSLPPPVSVLSRLQERCFFSFWPYGWLTVSYSL